MRLLVHLATGAEDPTRAALALLVAATAVAEGHDVDVFVAGDGVSVLRDGTSALVRGIGTGTVSEHLDKLRAAGAGLFASKMSAEARGMSAENLGAAGFTAAPPNKLVELIMHADRTVTY